MQNRTNSGSVDFGEFLYQLRKEKGLTQSELADKLDITNKAVSKWETGETFPETAMLIPLSKIFNVSVDELLNGKRKLVVSENSECYTLEKIADPTPAQQVMTSPLSAIIAVAVGLGIMLLGVSALIILVFAGFSHQVYIPILLTTVALGASIMIYSDHLKKVKVKELGANLKLKAKKIMIPFICGIFTIILCPSILICTTDFFNTHFIAIFTSFFLVLIAAIVTIICFGFLWERFSKEHGMDKMKFDTDSKKTNGKKDPLKELLSSIIFVLAVGVYLALGFTLSLWHPGWIVFIAAMLLGGFVDSVYELIKRR